MRRLLAVVTMLVLAVASAWTTAAPASASARLKVSNPANHEELSEQPGWVSLAFDGTVKRSLLKVLVLDSSGRNVVVGDLVYQGSAVLLQLNNDLPKGTYTVKYQVDRKDGQPEGGAYQFAYGKGTWTNVVASWSGTAQQPPEMANPDPMATGPVETPTTTPPVVEVSDEPAPSDTSTESAPASAQPSAGGTAPTESAAPSSSQSPAPGVATEGSSPVGWVIAGIAVLAAAGGGGWWLVRRRRQSEPTSAGDQ